MKLFLTAAALMFQASLFAFDCGQHGQFSRLTLAPEGPAAALPDGWTLGLKRVLYIRVRFIGDLSDPESEPQARQDLDEAALGFSRISYGRFSIQSTITQVLPLSRTAASYENDHNALLEDARMAASRAGYDWAAFDLEIVRHNPVPGFPGGYGMIGKRGVWLQQSGSVVILHEIGHNLGLEHANFWDTAAASSSPVVSPPFPSGTNEGKTGGHEFDPDSLIGHDNMIGFGISQEYGDVFDVMGGGDTPPQFNASLKVQLGWLDPAQVGTVRTSGVYRLHAFDVDAVSATNFYALRIERETQEDQAGRQYWIQYKGGPSIFTNIENGVQLHWRAFGVLGGETLLIDTTPGTSQRQVDASLLIGRTFSDKMTGVHVTPLRRGSLTNSWIDVSVEFDPAPAAPPLLELSATSVKTEPGRTIQFLAIATNSSGRETSFAWNFGDGSFGYNTNRIAHEWPNEGEYLVTCKASDLRGGVALRAVLVTVGKPAAWHISGRVIDTAGKPIVSARVHNGRTFRGPEAAEHVWSETDSDGFYTLAGLQPGTYTNSAYLPGFKLISRSLEVARISDRSITNSDFVLQELPTLFVRATRPRILEGQGDSSFIFTRTGPTNEALIVPFTVTGSAQPRRDYVDFFVRRVVIPAGAREVALPFNTLSDDEVEEPETVSISVRTPTMWNADVVENGATNSVTFYYPGWELRPVAGAMVWAQTDPLFVPGPDSAATVLIADPSPARLEVQANSLRASAATPSRHLLQASPDLVNWFGVSTNWVGVQPTELRLVTPSPAPQFYRTMQLE